ncbi:MAG: hypothetical protein AUI57_07035 [Candidatus Rokubacteria bacterium 13_1_40CM_2_68_8]|nr:MAG: hypothetical protein AUI57_07035 [Candidatus Rokubacteria bacterium 13_1_40CM_2_68_8]
MRVLLDEQLPRDFAAALQGHSVDTVAGRGWAGITNVELLRRMDGEYDALVPMDRGIPAILDVLPVLRPGQLHRIGG